MAFLFILWTCDIVAGLWKYYASPMSIPKECEAELAQERNLEYAVLATLICWPAWFVLCAMVAYDFYVHLKNRAKGKRAPHPYFPSVTLSEMLGLSFAFGLFPVMWFGAELSQEPQVTLLRLMAEELFLFPLIFVFAFNRLNARRVPLGWWRTLYVALYPLTISACSLQVLFLLVKSNGLNDLSQFPIVQVCLNVGVIGA